METDALKKLRAHTKAVVMRAMISNLMAFMHDIVETDVPEEGDFEPVTCQPVAVPEWMGLVAKHYWLKVFPAPKGIENHLVKRGLSLHADNGDASVHILACTGTKQMLHDYLKLDKENIQDLTECAEKLSDALIGLH